MRQSRIRKTWLAVLSLLIVLLLWQELRPMLLPAGPLGALKHYLMLIAQETILFGVPALLMRPWQFSDAGSAPRWPRGCLWALPVGIVLALLLNPVSAVWSSLMHMAPQETPLPGTALERVLMVMAMVVVPALMEEAFFRGGVLCGLAQGLSGQAAFLLTVAIFTLMHGRVVALPAHLVCGALFTLGMLRYGVLWPGMVMHAGYNAMTLALGWFGVTLPWLTLVLTVPAMTAMAAVMLRATVWRKRGSIHKMDAALGAATMIVLVIYFIVQL